MTCERARDLISARLDGELDQVDADWLDAHLSDCAECGGWADQAEALRRDLRLHAAAELADVPVPAAVQADAMVTFLRGLLFVIGGTLVVLKGTPLLFDVDVADVHLSRHDGVFGTALGIGMIGVAWRPHRAIGLVPLTSVLAILMAAVAINDLASDRVSMLAEAVHVLEFAGLMCLWVISGGVTRLRDRVSGLRSVPVASTVREWPST